MKTTIETSVKMLTDWNDKQFQAIGRAIVKHFRDKEIACSNGNGSNYYKFKTFAEIDQIFGLAYTSSGIFACYSVCNTTAYFDADRVYHYEFFTIGENGKYYAILWDNEENELCIEL